MSGKTYGVWRLNRNGQIVKIAENLEYDRAREIFKATSDKGFTTTLAPDGSKVIHMGYKWKCVAGGLWTHGWSIHQQDYSQPIVWKRK